MTRRVLLTAGGLTVLGLWGASRDHPAAAPTATVSAPAAASAPAIHPAAARPAASPHPASSGRPAGQAHSTAGTEPRLTAARRGPAPGSQGSVGPEPVAHLRDGPQAIAMTIDDGPSPVYTPQVLQLLARYRVTAAFSMIGIEVQAHPALAREVAAAGHLIVNHTWTHPDLTRLPAVMVIDQMSRAAGAIHAATGRAPGLFRAPYGAWSPFVLSQCARTGLTPLGWSVDPRDWSRPGVPAIVANIMGNTRTGSIILEHDGGGDRSQTVAALKIVIPRLLAAGYHFRTP